MKGKKILFLCGHYAFPSAANSICVQNLAEESIRQGHEPFVLARGCEYTNVFEEINGVKVWKYYGDSFGKVVSHFEQKKGLIFKLLFFIIQLMRYAYVLWIYPITSRRDLDMFNKRAQELIEQYGIDTIVATYGPYEAVQAAMNLKEKFKDRIMVVSYHLDLLTNPSNESPLILRLKQYRVKIIIKKEFSIVDKVFLPMTAPKFANPKFHYVDFPLYIPKEIVKNNNTTELFLAKDSINITIAGSLDGVNRNPLTFCSIIEKLPMIYNKSVVLHVWGRVTGIDFTRLKNVIYHGIANVEDVPYILQESDFLLNVGNKNSYRMLPSKIFQMFAAKKPIFFLYSSPQDRSIPYFKKYGHTYFIPVYDQNSWENIDNVVLFIERYYGHTIEVDDLLFEKSTPAYIVRELLISNN